MSARRPRNSKKELPKFSLENEIEEANKNCLDENTFLELVEVAIAALSGRRFALPPDAERCFEEGPPGSLFLTGIPENQMGLSLVSECAKRFGRKKGERVFHSFMWRWWAICDAKRSGHLTEFSREVGKVLEINTAVFRVAARFPLNVHGKFESDGFVRGIREAIRREEESDPS